MSAARFQVPQQPLPAALNAWAIRYKGSFSTWNKEQ
jgi:hypothetical protein